MALSDRQLVKIISSEKHMLQYLEECKLQRSDIDPIVWSIHFSVSPSKRMFVLNTLYDECLLQTRILYCFLPDHLIQAKVFKRLNIPYSITTMRGKSLVDDVKPKKFNSRTSRVKKLTKCYNMNVSNAKLNDDSGLYSFDEERPDELESYACFRSFVNIIRERNRVTTNRNEESVDDAQSTFRSYSRFPSNRRSSAEKENDRLFDSLFEGKSSTPKRRKDVQIRNSISENADLPKKNSKVVRKPTKSNDKWNAVFNSTTERAVNRTFPPLDVITIDANVDSSSKESGSEMSLSKNTAVTPTRNDAEAQIVSPAISGRCVNGSSVIKNTWNSNEQRKVDDLNDIIPYVSPPSTPQTKRRCLNNLATSEPPKELFPMEIQADIHRECTANDYGAVGVTVDKSPIVWSPKNFSTPNVDRIENVARSQLSLSTIDSQIEDTTTLAKNSSEKSGYSGNPSPSSVNLTREAIDKRKSCRQVSDIDDSGAAMRALSSSTVEDRELKKGYVEELNLLSSILEDFDNGTTNIENIDERELIAFVKKMDANRMMNTSVNSIADQELSAALGSNKTEHNIVLAESESDLIYSSSQDTDWSSSTKGITVVKSSNDESVGPHNLTSLDPEVIVSDGKGTSKRENSGGRSTSNGISELEKTPPSEATVEISNNPVVDEVTSDVQRARIKSLRPRCDLSNSNQKSVYTMSSSDSDDDRFDFVQKSLQYEHVSSVEEKNRNDVLTASTLYPNSDSDCRKSSNIGRSISPIHSNSDSEVFVAKQDLNVRKNKQTSRQPRQCRPTKKRGKTSRKEDDELVKMQQKYARLTAFKGFKIAKKSSTKALKSNVIKKKATNFEDDELEILYNDGNNETDSKLKRTSIVVSPSSDSGSHKTTSSATSALLSSSFKCLSLDNPKNGTPGVKLRDLSNKCDSSEELILDDSDLEYIGIPKPTEDIDEDLLDLRSWTMLTDHNGERAQSLEDKLDSFSDNILKSKSLTPNDYSKGDNNKNAVDDEDELDQFSDELDKQLADTNDADFRKTQKNTDDDDSVVSRDFDNDIRPLIMADRHQTKQTSPLTNCTQVLTMKTGSASKTNSTHFSQTNSQLSLNYKEILWGLYPDSMETALTTSDEKLKDARIDLRKRLEQVRVDDDVFRSSSKGNSGDDLSDWSWNDDA